MEVSCEPLQKNREGWRVVINARTRTKEVLLLTEPIKIGSNFILLSTDYTEISI